MAADPHPPPEPPPPAEPPPPTDPPPLADPPPPAALLQNRLQYSECWRAGNLSHRLHGAAYPCCNAVLEG